MPYHYKNCQWCKKPLNKIVTSSTPSYGCEFNEPTFKGFCSEGCLDAFCDRDDRRKEERANRRRY